MYKPKAIDAVLLCGTSLVCQAGTNMRTELKPATVGFMRWI